MHPVNEQDIPSIVLMVAGLLMSVYGYITRHLGFVLGGWVFFYMGVMILKPLPKSEGEAGGLQEQGDANR